MVADASRAMMKEPLRRKGAAVSAVSMAGTFVRKETVARLGETILANEELTRFSRAI